MYTLEVKEIEFDDYEKADKNKNYPESGFYLRTIRKLGIEECDLVFIDKSTSQTFTICPKSAFDGLQKLAVRIPEEPTVLTSNEVLLPMGMASETFVLEFAKVLLKK